MRLKKRILTIGAVAVVTLSGALFTDSVNAQPSLDTVKKEQKEVNKKLSKAEQKIADILYEIKEIGDEISRLDIALEENKKQIKKNEEEIVTLEEEIDALNAKIEQRNEILKDRISSYQDNGGTINYLDVVLGSKGFNEFISQISAISTITNSDLDLIKDNEADKQLVEEKVEDLEFVLAELEDIRETTKIQKEQQVDKKKELEKKEAKVKKEKSKLENKSAELDALESEIRASMIAPTPVATSGNGSSGGSSGNGTTASNSGGGGGGATQQVAYTGGGGSAIAAGRQFIGRSTYGYGAKNPSAGVFDCSGFVQWAYEQEGISLPRTAGAMASVGTKVPLSQAKPGDLVLFRGGGHVGIYLGGGKFLGSQNSTGVAVADMNSGYWKNAFDGNVRRIK